MNLKREGKWSHILGESLSQAEACATRISGFEVVAFLAVHAHIQSFDPSMGVCPHAGDPLAYTLNVPNRKRGHRFEKC